jgi:hypothetical protein
MQKAFLGLTVFLMCFYVSIVIIWCNNTDYYKNYLGGIDWKTKVFNWHPVLMSCSFGLFSYTAILSIQI